MTLPRRAIIGAAVVTPVLAMRVLAQADSPLEQPLHGLYAALETVMRAGRGMPFTQRFDILLPVIERVFDLETVLKVSVGQRWDGLDADTRSQLLNVYRRFTVATYVANFDKYDGERFRILPTVRDSGADRIVATEILTGRDHVRLDYVMRNTAGTWRAVDVLLEGSISRVAVQRSDFRKILANGDAGALIASLRHKIKDLSDGALSS